MSTPNSPRRRTPLTPRAPTPNILLYLIAFRLANAFAVRTFFQPDEYFQSLEPAWQIAFGQDQGAWLTWVSECDRVKTSLRLISCSQEWRHQLRSSLHPLFFAALYKIANFLASIFGASPATRAELLIAAPKTAQAVVAAIGDFYTWKLAVRVYGEDSRGAWTTVCYDAFYLNEGEKVHVNCSTAGCHSLKSLAMVLFDQDPVELPRNDNHDCCVRTLAMAMVCRVYD